MSKPKKSKSADGWGELNGWSELGELNVLPELNGLPDLSDVLKAWESDMDALLGDWDKALNECFAPKEN